MRYDHTICPHYIFLTKENKIYFEIDFCDENEFKNFLINYRFSENVLNENYICSDAIRIWFSYTNVYEIIYKEADGSYNKILKELKLLVLKYLKINLEESQIDFFYSDFVSLDFLIDKAKSISILPKLI